MLPKFKDLFGNSLYVNPHNVTHIMLSEHLETEIHFTNDFVTVNEPIDVVMEILSRYIRPN